MTAVTTASRASQELARRPDRRDADRCADASDAAGRTRRSVACVFSDHHRESPTMTAVSRNCSSALADARRIFSPGAGRTSEAGDDVGGRRAPAGGEVEAGPGRAARAAEEGVGALGDVEERLRGVLGERVEQRRDEAGLAGGPGCAPAGSRARSCRRRAAPRRWCRRRRRCSGPSPCSPGRRWSRRSGSRGSRRRTRRCRAPCACPSSRTTGAGCHHGLASRTCSSRRRRPPWR